jgi:hypothetical protein
LGVLAVGTVLAGCSAGSNSGPSYKDGVNFAQGEIQKGNPLIGNAQAECAALAAQGSVPDVDNRDQWVAGCEAALANQTFIGGS